MRLELSSEACVLGEICVFFIAEEYEAKAASSVARLGRITKESLAELDDTRLGAEKIFKAGIEKPGGANEEFGIVLGESLLGDANAVNKALLNSFIGEINVSRYVESYNVVTRFENALPLGFFEALLFA